MKEFRTDVEELVLPSLCSGKAIPNLPLVFTKIVRYSWGEYVIMNIYLKQIVIL